MDTSSLSYEQLKYLPLFREVLVESPVLLDNGTVMSFEDVVADINRTWLSHGCSLGIDGGGRFKCGSYCHSFTLNCQVCGSTEAWVRFVVQKLNRVCRESGGPFLGSAILRTLFCGNFLGFSCRFRGKNRNRTHGMRGVE